MSADWSNYDPSHVWHIVLLREQPDWRPFSSLRRRLPPCGWTNRQGRTCATRHRKKGLLD